MQTKGGSMPQLSLYLDDASMAQLRKNAAAAKLSLSKYALRKINEPSRSGWPDGWFDLYGSITDETFVAPDDPVPDPSDVPSFDELGVF